MKFAPLTEEEAKPESKPFPVWPSGIYDFEVVGGYDKLSKKKIVDGVEKGGNEMIELKIKIFNSEGEEKIIFDYLLESVSYKLRHAAEACGMLAKYNDGELVGSDFDGCTGKLKIRLGKPSTEYPDPKNEVVDYVVGAEPVKQKPKDGKKSPSDKLDDSIPF